MTGPQSAVMGHANMANEGTDVAHVKLTPVGAHTKWVTKGLRPCVRAYGHQARHHMNIVGSAPYPITEFPAKTPGRANNANEATL